MRAAIALALVTLSGSALAEQIPVPGTRDSSVRTIAYDPANVIRLETADLRSTLLQFGTDETVDIVALGDPTAWAFNKARNLLFIKPTLSPTDAAYAVRSHSNMQVVTLKAGGEQRVYVFELIATPAPGLGERPMLALSMTYPGDIAIAKRKAAVEAAAHHDEDVARQRLEVDYFYGERNWQYAGRGTASIEPGSVSDNGQNTAFRFIGNSPQPAIYQGHCDATDKLANTTNQGGDIVVAQGISPFWCLRQGEDVYEVASVHYDPTGQVPGTGTTSPDVVRRVKKAAR